MLSDTLSFERSGESKFSSNSEEISNIQNNLIISAKRLLEDYCNKDLNVNIFLDKNIPVGAGLGGGSSNAATTLKALNIIFSLNIKYPVLSSMALELGSDVPFFLNPLPSFAISRGEVLKVIPLSLSQPILIVNPGIHISTKWAFNKIDVSRRRNTLSQLSNLDRITLDDIQKYAKNDFEEIVFREYPDVQGIKEKMLSLGAEFTSMSGTGSSVYGIFSNLQNARRAESYFSTRNFIYLNYPVNKGSIT
jgi:4-diphosphocytidyl-2-C-methyl-D-erythritol kinase